MAVSKAEIIEALQQSGPQIGEGLADQVLGDTDNFSSYQGLARQELIGRLQPVLLSIIASFQADTSQPLLDLMDRILEARLRAGYDVNVMLRIVDAVSDQCVSALKHSRPLDEELIEVVRRRLTIFNNRCKLHLAQLNLAIPVSERANLDPALTKPRQ